MSIAGDVSDTARSGLSKEETCKSICAEARRLFNSIFINGIKDLGQGDPLGKVSMQIKMIKDLKLALEKALLLQEKKYQMEGSEPNKDAPIMKMQQNTRKMLESLRVAQQEFEFFFGLIKAKAKLLGKEPTIPKDSKTNSLNSLNQKIHKALESDAMIPAHYKQASADLAFILNDDEHLDKVYLHGPTSKTVTHMRIMCGLYYALESENEFSPTDASHTFLNKGYESVTRFLNNFDSFPSILLKETAALWMIDYGWRSPIGLGEAKFRLEGAIELSSLFNSPYAKYDMISDPYFVLNTLLKSVGKNDDNSLKTLTLQYFLAMRAHLEPPQDVEKARMLVHVRIQNELWGDALIFQRNLYESNGLAWDESLLKEIFAKMVEGKKHFSFCSFPLLEKEKEILNKVIIEKSVRPSSSRRSSIAEPYLPLPKSGYGGDLIQQNDKRSMLMESLATTTIKVDNALFSLESEFEESKRKELKKRLIKSEFVPFSNPTFNLLANENVFKQQQQYQGFVGARNNGVTPMKRVDDAPDVNDLTLSLTPYAPFSSMSTQPQQQYQMKSNTLQTPGFTSNKKKLQLFPRGKRQDLTQQ